MGPPGGAAQGQADPRESGVALGIDLGTVGLETGPAPASLVTSESMTMERVLGFLPVE